MKLTIDRGVFGKMTNMGQSCVAAKRFILLESVSDEFVDGFRERLAALKMGDPLDESTGVAPLSSVEAAARLEDQVNRSVAGGARVILRSWRLGLHARSPARASRRGSDRRRHGLRQPPGLDL